MVYAQTWIRPREIKIPWDFEIQTDQLIFTKRQNLALINKKKREFAIQWILPFWQTTQWK